MQKIFTEHCVPDGLLWWLSDKESTCQCRRCRLDPWVRKISWRRKWQPTPALLPGKFHGQRSLLQSLGSQRVIHNWATKQQQQLCSRHCLGTRDTSRNLEKTELLALEELCMPGMCWEQWRGLWYEPREGEQMLKSDREVKVWKLFSRVWLFVTSWTVACQAPLFMEFSRQEYWRG